MFIVSQTILKYTKLCPPGNRTTYSIALGLLAYATLYLYLLYTQHEFMSFFNKILIYVVGCDLLISTFLNFKSKSAATMVYEPQKPHTTYEHSEDLSELCEDDDSASETQSCDQVNTEISDADDEFALCTKAGPESEAEAEADALPEAAMDNQQPEPSEPSEASEPGPVEGDDEELATTPALYEKPKKRRGRPKKTVE